MMAGSQPKSIEAPMMRRMAIQKFGMESPRTPMIWTSVRTRRLRERLAGAKGPAEVALQHVAEPQDVLDRERLVEAELTKHRRALCFAELPLRPGDDVDDVAGEQAHEKEDEHGHAEEREDG